MKSNKFTADTHVSKELYNCANVLEDYLTKNEDSLGARWANQTLMRYNNLFKPLLDLKKHREYYAKMFMHKYIKEMKTDNIDPFVVSLVRNIMKTKYKIEIVNGTVKL